jgi:hypothetical protein
MGTVRAATLQCTLPPVGSFAFTVDLSQYLAILRRAKITGSPTQTEISFTCIFPKSCRRFSGKRQELVWLVQDNPT